MEGGDEKENEAVSDVLTDITVEEVESKEEAGSDVFTLVDDSKGDEDE